MTDDVSSLTDIRRFAVRRSLFPPTTLQNALDLFGFVQADPIRAPARAQDLTLRLRVSGYRAGDLERLYPSLSIEEDIFINYGFVTRDVHALMHPRTKASLWPHAAAQASCCRARLRSRTRRRASARRRCALLARDGHQLLGRIIERDDASARRVALSGTAASGAARSRHRVYAARDTDDTPLTAVDRRARMDALVDVLVRKYAPLAGAEPVWIISRLRYAAPQWRREVQAGRRAREAAPGAGAVDG